MLLYVKVNVLAVRKLVDHNGHLVRVKAHPVGNGVCRVGFNDCFEFFILTALVSNSYYVAGFEQDGRDVGFVAIKGIVTVSYELAGFFSGGSETGTIDNIVKAAFKNTKKVFTSLARLFAGELKIMSKLAFKNSVISLSLLFCAKLKTVFRNLLTALAVLAGSICSAINELFKIVYWSLYVDLMEKLIVSHNSFQFA